MSCVPFFRSVAVLGGEPQPRDNTNTLEPGRAGRGQTCQPATGVAMV